MTQIVKITESEFARICEGIYQDRESIIKYNPIGPPNEVLLWMLLSCLTSYLNLSEQEMPCFNNKPDSDTYRQAIHYVLSQHMADGFDTDKYLKGLTRQAE